MFSAHARATRDISGIGMTLSVWGWRHACTAQSLTLFCMKPCQLSASVHKFRVLFFLAVPCLLFATNLCLPGYRLLSDCDSDSAVPMAERLILPDHSLSMTAKL